MTERTTDSSVDNDDWFDSDGYPTDGALERIKAWDYRDFRGLMEFVYSIWRYADWGWDAKREIDGTTDRPVDAYYISTAGWSGNESVIEALKGNVMFWMLCWVQSRRGGHYIFHLQPEQAPSSEKRGSGPQVRDN